MKNNDKLKGNVNNINDSSVDNSARKVLIDNTRLSNKNSVMYNKFDESNLTKRSVNIEMSNLKLDNMNKIRKTKKEEFLSKIINNF